MRTNCAGILLMPVDDNNYNDSILSLSLSKFPTLFIDRRLYGLNINCVSSDHMYIGYNATSYLIKRNHESILFLSLSRNIPSVRQRLDGYENALNKHLNIFNIKIERNCVNSSQNFACVDRNSPF